MSLKIKAFIYRFSNIFGLRIYLAQKEEDTYVKSLKLCHRDDFKKGIAIGSWQARHGFTTVYVRKGTGLLKKLFIKTKHAFKA